MNKNEAKQDVIHVLGISGGKDSAALAIYMRDRIPNMHYYFCDTGEELPETYEYLTILETYLGKPIIRLNPDRPFSHYLKIYSNYLPSPRMRWCTAMLKIKPFEEWLEREFTGCRVKSYVAIRADEDRDGYISHKPGIEAVYPFKEGGIGKDDVMHILEDAGVNLPKYYEWRSRSGCYFCFFQRKFEWVGLKERHPEKFEEAKKYEKIEINPVTGEVTRYTWSQKESLEELERPERTTEIREQHLAAMAAAEKRSRGSRLTQVFEDVLEKEDSTEPCLICQL